ERCRRQWFRRSRSSSRSRGEGRRLRGVAHGADMLAPVAIRALHIERADKAGAEVDAPRVVEACPSGRPVIGGRCTELWIDSRINTPIINDALKLPHVR